jgi:iron(III) transport system ATP-binding protein
MEFLGSFYRAELGGGSLGEHSLRADFSINLVRRLGVTVGKSMPVRLPGDLIRLYPRSRG